MNDPSTTNPQRFDIDRPVPLDSVCAVEFQNHSQNNVSRVPIKPHRVATTPLVQVVPRQDPPPVRVIGVVVHPVSTEPARSRGRDYFMSVRLADDSLPDGLSLMFFAREAQQLPPQVQQGDVLLIHKPRLEMYDSAVQLQCTTNAYSVWALFPSNGFCRIAREQLSLSADDLKAVLHQRKWWREQRAALVSSPTRPPASPQPQQLQAVTSEDDSICYSETIIEEKVDQLSGSVSSGGVAPPVQDAPPTPCLPEGADWLPSVRAFLQTTMRVLERHLLVAKDHPYGSRIIDASLDEVRFHLTCIQQILDVADLDEQLRQVEDLKHVYHSMVEEAA